MDMPPSTTRDSLEMKLARSQTRNRTALAMSWASPWRRTGFLKGLAGVEFAGGRAGGGLVLDVGHNAAGPNAAVRGQQVTHMEVTDDGR